MAGARDWLEEGLAVLAEDGAPALTIDRLAGRLGVTKGSFYHHFRGMAGFKAALLAHFEAEWTDRYIAAVEAEPGSPRARLDQLVDLVLAEDDRPDPEIAIRAWALQDAEVRQVQERVDRTRYEYLRSEWLQLSGDAEEARRMGHVLYLVLIGAGQVIPPVPPGELREIYNLLMAPPAQRGADT